MDWIETHLYELATGLLTQSQYVFAFGSTIAFEVVHWRPLFPAIALIAFALAISRYRRWKRGWLSGLVEARISRDATPEEVALD